MGRRELSNWRTINITGKMHHFVVPKWTPLPLLHRFFIKSRLKHYWVYLIRHPLIVTFSGLYASIFSKSLVIYWLNSMIECHRYYLLSYYNGFHSNYIVKSQEKQFLTLKNVFNFHFCERGHCGSYKTYICY